MSHVNKCGRSFYDPIHSNIGEKVHTLSNKECCDKCKVKSYGGPGSIIARCPLICPCHTLSTVEEANFVDSMTPEERKHQSELEKTAVYTSTAPTSKASWEKEFALIDANKLGEQISFIAKQIEEAEERGRAETYQPNATVSPPNVNSLVGTFKEGFAAGKSEALRLVREITEEIKYKFNVDEYLPLVQAWNKTNFDEPFDHGYKQAKTDLLAHLDTLQANTKEV